MQQSEPDTDITNVNAQFIRFWFAQVYPKAVPEDPNDPLGVELANAVNQVLPILLDAIPDKKLVALWKQAVEAVRAETTQA